MVTMLPRVTFFRYLSPLTSNFAMKKLHIALLAAAAISGATAVTQAADFREHRAIYVTPYLSDWPTGAIRANNASTYQRILRNNLDNFKAGGVNVIYYHVRSMCDATYKSQYEPWSKGVGGTRGQEPAFDPLEYLVAEAHARGIEVYAWFNPYRYCGVYGNGESPLDYEYTHPEWLIVQPGKETILNPALDEVQQRICDVICDVIDNYDVDGVVFDDYFYSNPTPLELDADLYNAAKDADPTIGTQKEWRVANVNNMVRRVSEVIKEHRPWMPFGISPAGVASPPHVTSVYGLEPAPGSDWQYSSIASDPLNWYMNGYVDFMSPQIYWPNQFDAHQEWWNKAARKFGRHLYSSVSLSSFSSYGGGEFAREVESARAIQAPNESGLVFFRMTNYVNASVKYEGKTMSFTEYMGQTAYSTPVLTPLRPWNNVYAPVNVTGLHRDGSTLTWDAVEGMRYTVYAFAAGEEQRPFNSNLQQIVYTNSYEIPEDMTSAVFGVAVYDRYGNEYSMSTEGASLGEAVAAKLIYPAEGERAADLFDFEWSDTGSDNILEVAESADFAKPIVILPTAGTKMTSYAVPTLEEGKTYYWRVRTHGVNAPAAVSETRSFVASRIAINGPVGNDETTTPTVSCTPAYEGSVYKIEISRNSTFTLIDYTAESESPIHEVAPGNLLSGFHYYLRVTAMREGRSSTSSTVSFWTADVVPDVPTFVTPATEGATLHANEVVEIVPVDGASSMQIQIFSTPDYSGRYYRITLGRGESQSALLSKVRIGTAYLQDGETYYVRACSRYFTHANQSTETTGEYAVTSFVYSSTDGVSDVVADGSAVSISAEGILSMPVVGNDVAVYTPDGSCVFMEQRAAAECDLSHLASGLYIVKVQGPSPVTLKWIKK